MNEEKSHKLKLYQLLCMLMNHFARFVEGKEKLFALRKSLLHKFQLASQGSAITIYPAFSKLLNHDTNEQIGKAGGEWNTSNQPNKNHVLDFRLNLPKMNFLFSIEEIVKKLIPVSFFQ